MYHKRRFEDTMEPEEPTPWDVLRQTLNNKYYNPESDYEFEDLKEENNKKMNEKKNKKILTTKEVELSTTWETFSNSSKDDNNSDVPQNKGNEKRCNDAAESNIQKLNETEDDFNPGSQIWQNMISKNQTNQGKTEPSNKRQVTMLSQFNQDDHIDSPSQLNIINKDSESMPYIELKTHQIRKRNSNKYTTTNKCFACREMGHTIRECKVAKTQTDNICIKCGSKDHSYKVCTVYKGNVFNFALCFICKKTGHISSQCTERKNGIYPDGGNCRYCKSVDHFGYNCPNNPKNKRKSFNKSNKSKNWRNNNRRQFGSNKTNYGRNEKKFHGDKNKFSVISSQ